MIDIVLAELIGNIILGLIFEAQFKMFIGR